MKSGEVPLGERSLVLHSYLLNYFSHLGNARDRHLEFRPTDQSLDEVFRHRK